MSFQGAPKARAWKPYSQSGELWCRRFSHNSGGNRFRARGQTPAPPEDETALRTAHAAVVSAAAAPRSDSQDHPIAAVALGGVEALVGALDHRLRGVIRPQHRGAD